VPELKSHVRLDPKNLAHLAHKKIRATAMIRTCVAELAVAPVKRAT
jgi:hypothetical protein